MIPFQLHRRIPLLRRPFYKRDRAIADRDLYRPAVDEYARFVDSLGAVLQYRQAYFEVRGHVAPGLALPAARSWPRADGGLSYEQKLLGLLDISNGKGVELGPLNIPIVPKSTGNVLYVDHLDTAGLRAAFPHIGDIADIDRPIVGDSLYETLRADAPLDYFIASQVLEHVPDPIRWLREIAAILRVGGLVSLALPDRRGTFDLLREETRAADMVAAYLENTAVPNTRCVYDHHSLAALVNMRWADPDASVEPAQVMDGRGAVEAKILTKQHLALVERARAGEYLNIHAWVFTPPSFLMTMAKIAEDGFLPFRLHQFYPTDLGAADRCNVSFTVVLEKVEDLSPLELRRGYLEALGA